MRNFSLKLLPCLTTCFLAGCADDSLQRQINGRWGPRPVMQAADASLMLKNQLDVLGYISSAAGIFLQPGDNDVRWYNVAEWGFNIGRADCTIYLDNLFMMARQRTRTNGVLLDAAAAATAIVTATSPHSVALSIIAPAFGFAGNVSNRIFDSYLFSDTSPGLIQIKVKDLQDAYVGKLDPSKITSSAAAYSAIQGYYNICLPQSIEGVLLEKIATAPAVAASPTVAPPSIKGLRKAATGRIGTVPSQMVTPKVFLD